MLIKYILIYVIILLAIYFGNDKIVDLLSGNQVLIRFVELTLPLTIPSLVYFFQVNKDRHERVEKEEEKKGKAQKDEEDKFERSLPFFYVRNGTIFARNPQKSPILNVKIQIGTIKNDFSVLGKIGTKGAIHSEDNIPIGGMVDGDEKNIDSLLENNNIFKDIRWFVLSAITATNDTVYFTYLPCKKMGWHFYRKDDSDKSMIVKYIGDNSYCELAKLLVTHVEENGVQFSFRESILNDAVACLEENDLQGAFAQIIKLVRCVKELPKCEILYVLYNSYLMLHQLESFQKIEPNYFQGNLSEKCDFTDKYMKQLENRDQESMMIEYLQDIIKIVNEDGNVSLDFWLRNVEVYIRDQSRVSNANCLKVKLRQTIPPLVGGLID